MDILKFTNFLTHGAFLQTGPERFMLHTGPFKQISLSELAAQNVRSALYKPVFWDFLQKKSVPSLCFLPLEQQEISRDEFIDLCVSAGALKTSVNLRWFQPDKESFRRQFDWIQNQIQMEKLQKALPLTVQKSDGFQSEDKQIILRNILSKNIPGFAYGWWNQSRGFVGCTPELLGDWDAAEASFQTMALAGTWPKLHGEKIHFDDPKVQREHQIVVEDINIQLQGFQKVQQAQTEVVELPHLFHLKTESSYRIAKVNEFVEAFQKLHPTAALGLFPRTQEQFQAFHLQPLQAARGEFGAPFGMLGAQGGRVIVGIRNIMWNLSELSIFSGCGITKDSNFELEWIELEEKRESVKKLLEII